MSNLSDADLAAVNAFLGEEFGGTMIDVEPDGALAEETPELKIDARGRAHGADGKFVAEEGGEETTEEEQPESETPENVVEENEAEASQETTEEETDELVYEIDDPDVLEYLTKYDGDVVKALKAAREAQSFIGRQSNELGEMRQHLVQLTELVKNQSAPQPVQYVGPYQNDIDENPEALLYEALERGDGQTMQQAIEAWGEVDPFKAAIFVTGTLPQILGSFEPPEQQSQPATSVESEFAAFKERHPDVDKHLQGIQKVLSERPHLNAAVASGDPKARAQAFEDAYLLARGQGEDPDTSAAVKKVILKAKAEADKAKADAAVVSANKASAAEATLTGNALLEQVLKGIAGNDDFKIA